MTSIVVLPNGTCGLAFKGSPPCVQSVTKDSPLRGQIHAGMYVHGFVARKQDVVYSGIGTATELGRLLKKHVNDVRVLIMNSKVNTALARSMTTTLSLPRDGTSLGVVFTGTRISDIRAGSPLEHVVAEGMYVHALSAPGMQYMGIPSAQELKNYLTKHQGEHPRKMVLSHRPSELEPTIKITLPAGPLHLQFKDSKPTCILDHIPKHSPLYGKLEEALSFRVTMLEAPQRGPQKQIHLDQKFSSWELDKMLRQSQDNEFRVLTLVQDLPQGSMAFSGNVTVDSDETITTLYPTPEDAAMILHRQERNEDRLGRGSFAVPENKIGTTVDFSMRTGKEGFASMQDAYHFDDWNEKPFLKREFRFIEYPSEGTAKDFVLQDGSKKVAFIADSIVDGRLGFAIHGFHPRLKTIGSEAKMKWGMQIFKWAIVRDLSWKDGIHHRQIDLWNGEDYENKYTVRKLELSKHHLMIHDSQNRDLLVAVLFRREYTDGSERHKWVVSVAPGIDPSFMMCVTASLDMLIVD